MSGWPQCCTQEFSRNGACSRNGTSNKYHEQQNTQGTDNSDDDESISSASDDGYDLDEFYFAYSEGASQEENNNEGDVNEGEVLNWVCLVTTFYKLHGIMSPLLMTLQLTSSQTYIQKF